MRIAVFFSVFAVSSSGISGLQNWTCGEELLAISTEVMLKAPSISEVHRQIQDVLLTRKPGQWNVFASQYARNEAAFIDIKDEGWRNSASIRNKNPNLCVILDTSKAWILMVARTEKLSGVGK
ncbi:unnamed protein product [Bursaphelenchus xylophilus]|uniref:(pine wood nematode) hypothetical protein n=1 Tax=Bursaphelenchus xylophilus TaxID=6326 RepID=A0A1I7SV62_BURXY|nr:unnamed protein product [Bursaphelenchus xylophilus]CAG9100949.1 unnamed protein product [Bursaphelenchus xylophilus]